MKCVVRTAVRNDAAAIVEAYLASWRAAYYGLLPDDVIDEQAQLRRGYDWHDGIVSPTSEVAVAVDDDQIVGVVQAADAPGGERDLPEITMLYVVPSSWGGSAARGLLTAGTDWIGGHGHQADRLRVVEDQARARRFYEREGWTMDTEIPPAHNEFFHLIYYRRSLRDPS